MSGMGCDSYLSDFETFRRQNAGEINVVCEHGRDQGLSPGNLRGFTCMLYHWFLYPTLVHSPSLLFVNRN